MKKPLLQTIPTVPAVLAALLIGSAPAAAHDWVTVPVDPVSVFFYHPTVVSHPVVSVPVVSTVPTVATVQTVAPTVYVQTAVPTVAVPSYSHVVDYPMVVPGSYSVGTGYMGVVWP